MSRNRHDRSELHFGDLPGSHVELTAAIGPIPAGATVEDVLRLIYDRVFDFESGQLTYKRLYLNAVIEKARAASLTLNAYLDHYRITLDAIIRGANLPRLVGVGSAGGDPAVVFSVDGSVWFVGTLPAGVTFQLADASYGNGQWMAAAQFTTNPGSRLLASANGLDWTDVDIGFGASLIHTISYLNSAWIAGGESGKRAYSVDGQAWTLMSAGLSRIRDAAYGNGIWMTVGDGGRVYTATAYSGPWTLLSSFTLYDLYGVGYANGRWVIVGERSLYISNDGANWSDAGGVLGDADQLQRVAYGNGVWVAAGYDEGFSDPVLVTSPNGVDWTRQVLATSTERFILEALVYTSNEWWASGYDPDAIEPVTLLFSSADGVIWGESDALSVEVIMAFAYKPLPFFGLDAIRRRTQAASFTLDAVVASATVFTLDSLLQRTATGTIALDAIRRATPLGTFTLDAVIAAAASAFGATLDAILGKTIAGSHTLDAVIGGSGSNAYDESGDYDEAGAYD